MRLAEALGDLVDVPQFFVWRLTWLPSKSKYEKTPYYADPEGKGRDNWMDYQSAVALLERLRATGGTYTLGWYLTAETGYWFFDIDGCINQAGELSEIAQWAYSALPGAFTELSSSGRGLHFVGRGQVPKHASVNKPCNLEFYTADRGIAFGLNDQAEGCADSDHGVAVGALVAHWFPYVEHVALGSGPRAEWRGPTDDDELLRRALGSASAGSILNGRASFKDLWERNVAVLARTYPQDGEEFGASEADGALAMQLAFWTGCDGARIERLMYRSALVRDKWKERRGDTTYIGLTISRACGGVSTVLQDKEAAPVVTLGVDSVARRTDLLQRIQAAEDDIAIRTSIAPEIARDSSIEQLDRDMLAKAIHGRLKELAFPASLKQCKALVQLPKVLATEDAADIPEFATEHVYVEQGDIFFNTSTGDMLSKTAFQARYNRSMPNKQNGDKEDAAKWCLERWGTRTVHDVMYVPKLPPVFMHAGRLYANLYSPSTVPETSDYTPEGIAAINLFARHMLLFCNGREDVYGGLLAWMAFNVQNPGRKIRYAPLLKGIPGDGKSIVSSILKAAMGYRNVSQVGPKLVANSGGFTDWAHGACVISMEELMMSGKDRYTIANSIKENITNDDVTINRKHKGQLPIINVSNFIGSTNHANAAPIEEGDRRWWVIFSSFSTIEQIGAMHGVADFPSHFSIVQDSVRDNPGQWRKWLLEMAVPASFNPDGHAPMTDEKVSMRNSGENIDHSIARQVIEAGAQGVTSEALSSAALTTAMRAVCILEGGEVPKGSRVNEMLNDLKFQALCTMKIEGKIHRVWVKPGVSRDRARELLVASYQVSSSVAR